jgi:hypothetical protein
MYARNTTVSEHKSRAEIETLLAKYGATAFAYATETATNSVTMVFQHGGHTIRFHVVMPTASTLRRAASRRMTDIQAAKAEADERRRLWRSLCLLVKAKLEGVASGITAFETEFLPYTVLPNGQTVKEWAQPQIQAALSEGKMPQLLLVG